MTACSCCFLRECRGSTDGPGTMELNVEAAYKRCTSLSHAHGRLTMWRSNFPHSHSRTQDPQRSRTAAPCRRSTKCRQQERDRRRRQSSRVTGQVGRRHSARDHKRRLASHGREWGGILPANVCVLGGVRACFRNTCRGRAILQSEQQEPGMKRVFSLSCIVSLVLDQTTASRG
jgi:hypothetical protein